MYNKDGDNMVDLHIHTTYSDGTDSPFEVLKKADKLGIKQIAITDHNCIKGALEAVQYSDSFSTDVIIGCELSCDFKDKEVHLLGYFGREVQDNSAVESFINAGLLAREKQHKDIISKFNKLGMSISYDELEAMFPNIIRNRVHIARLLVSKGYVESVAEVFDNYVNKGMPCYSKKINQPLEDAISAIHKCGGLAVMAHFYQYKKPDFEDFFGDVINELDGIEVYHPSHNEQQRAILLAVAKKHSKLVTGGSDYHGTVKPDIELGCANVPDECMLYV